MHLFQWILYNASINILLFRICVVTLAPNHKVLNDGPIKAIDYIVNGVDLVEDNPVNGKRKTNAIRLKSHTIICNVETEKGNKVAIRRLGLIIATYLLSRMYIITDLCENSNLPLFVVNPLNFP